MNAATTAVIAATAAHAAEKALLEKLHSRGASESARAAPLRHLEDKERKLVPALVKKGCLSHAGENAVYVTAKGQAALRKSEVNGGMLLLILLVIASLLLTILGLAIALGD